jgi:GT2 family glycosyltransferase
LAGFARYHGRLANAASATAPVLTGPAGAGAAFRREAWAQVGGLDEQIPAYLEDLDLALRLRQAGWATEIALDAVAVHIGSATFGHRSAHQRLSAGYARGYLLRRYRVLRTRAAARALLTEAIVVAGDAVLSRDTAALRGRIQGWRAARTMPPRPFPPATAIDRRIGMRRSLRLRLGAYGIRP